MSDPTEPYWKTYYNEYGHVQKRESSRTIEEDYKLIRDRFMAEEILPFIELIRAAQPKEVAPDENP